MKNVEGLSVEGPKVEGSGVPAVADADASTRQRVAASILEHGPSTAAALAERLGLTPAGVRRHLDVLAAAGHVEPREPRVYGARGRGRPAKAYALTDAGRAAFYTAYDLLAVQALEFLADAAGPDAVTAFAESRIADLEDRYRTLAEQPGDATPAEVLAAALTAEGYVATTLPSAQGEQLCQHHCPIAAVAVRFPQLCEAETAAFSRLLGGHVQRLATIAHGDGVCTTHIPRAAGTTHTPRASGTTHIPRMPSRAGNNPPRTGAVPSARTTSSTKETSTV